MSFRSMQTPTSSRNSRTASPPQSISSTAFQQQKLNVVTRLALEGKTKSTDGAAIKMYIKISLPLDTVTPGSSIALFPEESVKIIDSQVHPIDNSSAPYDFSSAMSPLLNKAAKALGLPARSPQSYLSLFGMSSSTVSTSRHSASTSSSASGTNAPPLDEKYTGSILVSGYNVSFVVPKEFPPRLRGGESDINGFASRSTLNKRRGSITDKNVLQFMAAIDMWVPYVSAPPKSPYLLSIPIPRCLSNQIKLRIFPPTTSTSNSYASLSSAEDENSTWDLTSDPHVTRTTSSRRSQAASYNDLADDESSDSTYGVSPGFADGCGIQGTFPSAEHIRVRWATPLKAGDVPETNDGRRRAGVRDVKGEMTCTVLGKRADGVLMKLDYKGSCKGVWFPGVATLLGMDVALSAPDSKISWPPGMDAKWSVNGSTGFTGFAVGPPLPGSSRASSTASTPQHVFSLAVPNGPVRQDSLSSTASLLRTPLPAQGESDQSFENSILSTGTMSSLGSLGGRSRASSVNDSNRPPTVPITVHVNMNDLLTPSNNNLTFNISGVVLISPRPGSSDGSDDESDDYEQPVQIPQFRVVYNDTETTSTTVRSEVADSVLEVYAPTGNIQDPKARRTVLHKGGSHRCGSDSVRLVLRPVTVTTLRAKKDDFDVSRTNSPPSRPRTPNGASSRYANNSLRLMASTLKPKRDGPLMIPSVAATVTPLMMDGANLPNAYAVKVSLPAPSDADSEWLEFGLAQPGDASRPPLVEVASASVQGVPVRFETTAAVKQEKALEGTNLPFDQMSGKEWVSWVRVHVGDLGGDQVEVVYLTKMNPILAITNGEKRKKRASDDAVFNVLLPTFSLPVGRLEVDLEFQTGFEIASVQTNLSHQQVLPHCRKLLHYSMEELFYPRVTVSLRGSEASATVNRRSLLSNAGRFLIWTAPALLSVVLFFFVLSLSTELRQMKTSLDSCSLMVEAGWDVPEPVTTTFTVTTTYYPPLPTSTSTSAGKWWFTSDAPSATPLPEQPPAPEPVPVKESVTTPSLTTLTPTVFPTPTSHGSALVPLRDILRWTLHFEFPPADVAAAKFRRGVFMMWQIVRKVYHYPLDPP